MEFDPKKFDREYYNRISQFINSKDNVVYNIADLTDDPEKFIYHLKCYMHMRTDEFAEIEFNSLTETEIMYGATYSQFRVLEFFEQVCRDNDRTKAFGKVNLPTKEIEKKEEPKTTTTTTTYKNPFA